MVKQTSETMWPQAEMQNIKIIVFVSQEVPALVEIDSDRF
jgi:hypothetical protein